MKFGNRLNELKDKPKDLYKKEIGNKEEAYTLNRLLKHLP